MPEHLAVLLPNWIGDVVMATPTLRALRGGLGPDATITAVMRPYVSQVLAGTEWFDQTVYFDRRSKDADLRTWSVARKLRSMQLDTIIAFPNSLSSGLLAWLSGAKRRVGYVRNGRGPLFNSKLYPPREGRRLVPVSAVDYYLQLASAVGCTATSRQPELVSLDQDEQVADRIWDALGLSSSRHVVLLNTGSATGSARSWPIEYFTELARRVVDRGDASVLVLCGPKERDTAAQIARDAAHRRVHSMADQDLSLGVSKACIRRGSLMVTTDSGPRHLAAAFCVPTIALFGPIDPRWSVNYNPHETQLLHEVPCGPCGKQVCPLGHHRCMRDLDVDRVYAQVDLKLNTHPSRQVA